MSVSVGPDSPTVHILVPHPHAESVVTLAGRLDGDAEYGKAAASFLALPAVDPPFVRCDSSLHAAVATMPAVERPAAAAAGPDRVIELRTYRSASEPDGRRKIEMFETGGEIAIFRRVGLHVVLLARDLVGEGLPSLTYLLVFADAATREKTWASFREDPEWHKLRASPRYTEGGDIVSVISSALLRPTDYSQL